MDDYPSAAPTRSLSDTLAHEHAPPVLRGTCIGRYVVVDHIGAGGMGSVYTAYDAQLTRRIAIKVLRPDARSQGGHARLLREAQAMARLSHPNVLSVHDVGTFGDDVFIGMEYIEGRTLKAWMRDAHSWREAVEVLRSAGRGLAAAHAAGLVHRDFKPENVLLGNDGRVVVADFGIARAHSGADEAPPAVPSIAGPVPAGVPSVAEAVTGSSSPPSNAERSERSALETPLTETGAFVGTVGYMAPERAFEFRDDARSDQFAFGVTLYRVLYGHAPYPYRNLETYMAALLSPPLPPPAGTRVPAWVQAVIARAMRREPSERFPSMDALLAALDRDPTRERLPWAAGALAIALAGALTFGWLHHRRAVREECASGARLIAQTWSPSAREAVGAAIGASGAPLADETAKRTQRVLDDWSTAWASAHREASEATRLRGVESTATMNLRLACLERERDEMGALVERLSHADQAIAFRSLVAAYQLPQPKICWEPNAARVAALPDDPATRERVLALHRRLAGASALRMTGGCSGVPSAASAGIDEARALRDRRSEAEFLMLRAECERQQGEADATVATREDAFAAAIAAGDDSLAALAAARIAWDLTDDLAKPHEAEHWLKIGRGILEREGTDARADAELLVAEIEILSSQGYADRAIDLRDRAIALLANAYGPSHPAVTSAINNKATNLNSLGRHEEAIAEERRGIAIDEALFGADNPMLHVDYNNVGVDYTLLARYDEARGALEHALALAGPLGETSPTKIALWASMAVLDNRAGSPDAALADVGRAIAIAGATEGNGARYEPCLDEERGTALLAKGDVSGALDACARAVKLQEAQGAIGPDQVYSDDALTCLGEAELAAGRADAAIGHLERGVTLTKRDWEGALPVARLALAGALHAAGRDPRRVHDLAEGALSALRTVPGTDARAREAQALLAQQSTKKP